MSNKLIESLVAGNLTKTGKVSFDLARPAYLVEFNGGKVGIGKVGVYAQSPVKLSWTYMEISLEGNPETLKTSTAKSGKFYPGESINVFFDEIFNSMARIANTGPENPEEVDPEFIKTVWYYNPKGEPKLTEFDLAQWAITDEQKLKLSQGKMYYSTASTSSNTKAATKKILDVLKPIVKGRILDATLAGNSSWTVSGTLAVDVKNTIENTGTMLADFNKLQNDVSAAGLKPPKFTDLVIQALEGSDWTLARDVDLEVSPFIYVYPKTGKPVNLQPAVGESDPSVQKK